MACCQARTLARGLGRSPEALTMTLDMTGPRVGSGTDSPARAAMRWLTPSFLE